MQRRRQRQLSGPPLAATLHCGGVRGAAPPVPARVEPAPARLAARPRRRLPLADRLIGRRRLEETIGDRTLIGKDARPVLVNDRPRRRWGRGQPDGAAAGPPTERQSPGEIERFEAVSAGGAERSRAPRSHRPPPTIARRSPQVAHGRPRLPTVSRPPISPATRVVPTDSASFCSRFCIQAQIPCNAKSDGSGGTKSSVPSWRIGCCPRADSGRPDPTQTGRTGAVRWVLPPAPRGRRPPFRGTASFIIAGRIFLSGFHMISHELTRLSGSDFS